MDIKNKEKLFFFKEHCNQTLDFFLDKNNNDSLFSLLKNFISIQNNDIEINIEEFYVERKNNINLSEINNFINNSKTFFLEIFIKIAFIENGQKKDTLIIPLVKIPDLISYNTFLINGLKKTFIATLSKKQGIRLNKVNNEFLLQIIPKSGSRITIKSAHNCIFQIGKLEMIWFEFLQIISGKKLSEILEDLFNKVDLDISNTRKTFNEIQFITFIQQSNVSVEYLTHLNVNNLEESIILFAKELYANESIKIIKCYDNHSASLKSLLNYKLMNNQPINENNVNYIQNIFNNINYSLGFQAIDHINTIVGLNNLEDISNTLRYQDYLEIIKFYLDQNSNTIELKNLMLDINSLSNRYIFSFGDFLYKFFFKVLHNLHNILISKLDNLRKFKKNDIDLIKTLYNESFNSQVLTFKLLQEINLSSSIQLLDQTNIIAEILHLNKITFISSEGITIEQATQEIRNMHFSSYGRICCLATPEGPHSGLVVYATEVCKLNIFGNLLAPLRPVKNKVILDEIHYVGAMEEDKNKYVITEFQSSIDQKEINSKTLVVARKKSRFILVDANEVNYIDYKSTQIFSFGLLMVPFLTHNDTNRATTAASMQKQAISLIYPEFRKISSGVEQNILDLTNYNLYANADGEITYVDNKKIILKSNNNESFEYQLNKILTNQHGFNFQKPLVNLHQQVKLNEKIATSYEEKNGQWCNGVNLLTAIMPFEGLNFEDSVVISERIIRDKLLTSITTKCFTTVLRKNKWGNDISTINGLNCDEFNLNQLDENGIIKVNSIVKKKTILVGKFSPRKHNLLGKNKLLQKFFGATMLDYNEDFLLSEIDGVVTDVNIIHNSADNERMRIVITISKLQDLEPGDKIAGRYGNKMVCSKILPIDQMPVTEDGTPIDMIINPLGIPSRMNIGQIAECYASQLIDKRDDLTHLTCNPDYGITIPKLIELMQEVQLPLDGKRILINTKTNRAFEKPVVCGYMYIHKLVHMVSEKIHVRSLGPRHAINLQAVSGKEKIGGQKIGEMENWALQGYGASDLLFEKNQLLSDNSVLKEQLLNDIINNKQFDMQKIDYHISDTLNLFQNYLTALSIKLDINLDEQAPKSSVLDIIEEFENIETNDD